MKSGLLGRKLGHSYSPQIHEYFGSYSYDLFEKEPEEVGTFVKNGDFALKKQDSLLLFFAVLLYNELKVFGTR